MSDPEIPASPRGMLALLAWLVGPVVLGAGRSSSGR